MFLIRFQNFYYSSKQLSHSGVFQIAKGLIEPRGTSWADWKCGEPRPKAVEAREGSTSNAGRRGTAWFMSQEWQPSPIASFISLTWGMLLRGKPMEMGQCFKNAPFFYAQTLPHSQFHGFLFPLSAWCFRHLRWGWHPVPLPSSAGCATSNWDQPPWRPDTLQRG